MGVTAVWLPSSQSKDAKAASKRWQCACAAQPAQPAQPSPAQPAQPSQPAQAHRGRAMLFNSWRIRNHLVT